MAFELSNITDYVARENAALTKALFTDNDTANFAMYMANVKGSTTIPLVKVGGGLQSGNCATPDGDDSVSTVDLSVKPFTKFHSFCLDDLQTKLPNLMLAPGSRAEGMPTEIEARLVDGFVSDVNKILENTHWQGDTEAGAFRLYAGFIKLIDTSGEAIDGNTSNATSITVSNVKQLVDDMRTVAPKDVKRDDSFTIVVGDDVFDLYIAAEKADNLYHYAPEHDNGIYRIGGSRGILSRQYGLDGTSRMFAGLGQSFIVGNDVDSEKDVVDAWYDKTTDKFYMRIKGKSGVTVANADEIVEFTVSA